MSDESSSLADALSDHDGAPPEARRDRPEGRVPLAAMLSERERRQAAERELEALRAAPAAAPETTMGAEAPDPFQALNDHLEDSEFQARQTYGDEVVDAVQEWAAARMQADPGFAHGVLSHADPYAFVLEAFVEAGSGAGSRRAVEAPPVPPRSLVSAPSAGGAAHTPVGSGQAFDALFRR